MYQNSIVFVCMLVFITHCDFPKIIWTFWESDLDSTPYLRVFDENHRKVAEKDGWEVRHLDKNSALMYLK